ncbi:polysaccharide synthesis protein GtrA [Pseudorhodoferax sp. Leaf274]|nr:polysaccharide synthesis protein GtrA [Pseudorhodoferax sp. Leaf274]
MPASTFAKFCIAGALGFVVDVAVLYAASGLLGWYAARVLSFLCAATATWVVNRRHTFADGPPVVGPWAMGRQYLLYLLSMLGGGAVNYLAYSLVLQLSDARYAPALGVAVGSGAGLVVNFLLARRVVFRAGRQP